MLLRFRFLENCHSIKWWFNDTNQYQSAAYMQVGGPATSAAPEAPQEPLGDMVSVPGFSLAMSAYIFDFL